MTERSAQLKKIGLISALSGVGAGAFMFAPAAVAEIMAPGNGFAIGWQMIGAIGFVILFLTVPLVAIVSLLFMVNRRLRSDAVRFLLASVCFGGACFASGQLAIFIYSDARRGHFEELALRTEPLIEAISRYEVELGQPPPDLEALVPGYLKAIPGTGLGAYPEYHYRTFPDDETDLGRAWYDLGPRYVDRKSWLQALGLITQAKLVFQIGPDGIIRDHRTEALRADVAKRSKFGAEGWSAGGQQRQFMVADLIEELQPVGQSIDEVSEILGKPDGERIERAAAWELYLNTPNGIIDFDVFFYWPRETYPDYIYGGFVERIADWAYVHE